jgi:hypothetical protein
MTTEQADSATGHPLDPEPNSATLLDVMIKQAIYDMLEHLDGRKNESSNLHPLVTKALFVGTKGLSTRELLRLLMPEVTPTDGPIGESERRQAKHFRSKSNSERGFDLQTVRMHCLSLLVGRGITNAEAVRAWTFALIHAGVLQALHWHDAYYSKIRTDEAKGHEVIESLVPFVREATYELLDAEAQRAYFQVEKGHAREISAVFLNYSSGILLTQTNVAQPVLKTIGHLLNVVYPEFDAYGDPTSLQ